jgi:ketosteroid isomerase-like protein
MRALIIAVIALVAIAARADNTADQKAVMQTDRDFYTSSTFKGAEAWGDFASDDAHLPYGNGKAEIAAAMAKSYAKPGFRLQWGPDYSQVFGDLAVTSGTYELVTNEKHETGRYVTVWRRQKDGLWRFVYDGGTPGAH